MWLNSQFPMNLDKFIEEILNVKLLFCAVLALFLQNLRNWQLCPNEHLSNKGIKQTTNSRRIVLIYWSVTGVQYSVLWLGFSNRRLVIPPGTKLGQQLLLLFCWKNLGGKTDSVAIFFDSKLVNATLWASRSFKLNQFP